MPFGINSVPISGGAGPEGEPSDSGRFQKCLTKPRRVKAFARFVASPLNGTGGGPSWGLERFPFVGSLFQSKISEIRNDFDPLWVSILLFINLPYFVQRREVKAELVAFPIQRTAKNPWALFGLLILGIIINTITSKVKVVTALGFVLNSADYR